jgi:hypothetical protein
LVDQQSTQRHQPGGLPCMQAPTTPWWTSTMMN